jgi:hypothetical protein
VSHSWQIVPGAWVSCKFSDWHCNQLKTGLTCSLVTDFPFDVCFLPTWKLVVMMSTNSLRNNGQCFQTIFLNSSNPRPEANNQLISHSDIYKSPLEVAELTSLLMALCHPMWTLPSLCHALGCLVILSQSSWNNTYSVSSANVRLLLERILKHFLKAMVCLCFSSFDKPLVQLMPVLLTSDGLVKTWPVRGPWVT